MDATPSLPEIGPFSGEGEHLCYRACDFCHQTAVRDVWDGKRAEADWRKFYLLPDGCSLCSNCLRSLGKDELDDLIYKES